MATREVKKIVDGLLEGKALSSFITNPIKPSIEGKFISGAACPHCSGKDVLQVTKVCSESNGCYTVVTKCSECNEVTEVELLMDEDSVMAVKEDRCQFDGRIFTSIMESGLMNGNYLKFNSGVKGFIVKNGNDNIIVFEDPGEDSKPLNTRVTYKVISFRNGQAKLISMVNDKASGFKAGTIFYAAKNELQQYAKMSKPRQNPAMAGKFKY